MTNIVLDIEEPAGNPKKRRSLKYLIFAIPLYLVYFFLGDFVAKLYAIHKEKFYIFVMVTVAESILLPGNLLQSGVDIRNCVFFYQDLCQSRLCPGFMNIRVVDF